MQMDMFIKFARRLIFVSIR